MAIIIQIRPCFNELYCMVQYEYNGKRFWRTRRASDPALLRHAKGTAA